MNGRLTIREFEFLQRVLQLVEDIGNGAIRNDSFGDAAGDAINFFGTGRVRIIDTTNQVRILKDKINQQAIT